MCHIVVLHLHCLSGLYSLCYISDDERRQEQNMTGYQVEKFKILVCAFSVVGYVQIHIS
jgi:hypothetical protein